MRLNILSVNFFEGLYFSKKVNIKNFKIKTRIIKSLVEKEIYAIYNFEIYAYR